MTTPPLPLPPACEAFDAALADYLEQTLDADALAVAESHRASCERCDALVRELDVLRLDAAQLPSLTPSRDLWPGIAARIGNPISSFEQADARRSSPRPRVWTWTPARTAAAAALVLAAAGTTTYVASRTTTHQPPQTAATSTPSTDTQSLAATTQSANTPSANTPSAGALTPKTVTPVAARKQSTEATYAQEIAGLHAIVEQRRTQLDPHTRAVIEHNLQVIDTAIAESRRALATDPHSGFLADQLDQALDTKLELMRTVALLPSRT